MNEKNEGLSNKIRSIDAVLKYNRDRATRLLLEPPEKELRERQIADARDTEEAQWEADMEKVFYLEYMQDPERQQQMFSNVDSHKSAASYLEIEMADWMSDKRFDRRS